MSTLYQQWQNIAYDETADRSQLEKFWGTYFQIEKEIYEKLLSNPDEAVKGTVKELAEKFGQDSRIADRYHGVPSFACRDEDHNRNVRKTFGKRSNGNR